MLDARARDLPAYDTSYLLLAEDRGLPLATLEQPMAQVANASGVALVL